MSDVLSYNGYQARVEFDADDRIFFGKIAEINDGIGFHAARWPENLSSRSMAIVPVLGRLLRAAYDLIVVDCPSILAHPHLPTVSGGAPQVLLVVKSETSSPRQVQRAKKEIEMLRGNIWGAVLTGQRQIMPTAMEKRI